MPPAPIVAREAYHRSLSPARLFVSMRYTRRSVLNATRTRRVASMFLRAWTIPIILIALLVVAPSTLQAASSYADPLFKAQWEAGEAITPNFWGPLANAKDGQQEDYKEAQ